MVEFKEILNRIKNWDERDATYWGVALSGEVGEVCNLIKKYVRDGVDIVHFKPDKHNLGSELTHSFMYMVMLAQHFGLDLEEVFLKCFDEIDKAGWN